MPEPARAGWILVKAQDVVTGDIIKSHDGLRHVVSGVEWSDPLERPATFRINVQVTSGRDYCVELSADSRLRVMS